MRIPWIPLLILLCLSVFSDIYIYRSLVFRVKNRLWSKLQLWTAIGCYILLICALAIPRRDGDNAMLLTVMWMLYVFATVYLPNIYLWVLTLLAKSRHYSDVDATEYFQKLQQCVQSSHLPLCGGEHWSTVLELMSSKSRLLDRMCLQILTVTGLCKYLICIQEHTDLTPHSYLVLSMRSMLRTLMS